MAPPPAKKSRSEINKRCRNNKNYPEEEDRNMVHYLAERAKQTDVPLSMALLWRDYMEWSGSDRSVSGLRGRFRRQISVNIHRMTNYDTECRVRMLFATRTRVDETFLEELRQFATVNVDPNGVIIEYNDANTGLHLVAFTRKGASSGETENNSGEPIRPVEDLDYDSEIEEITYDGEEQREQVRKITVRHPKTENFYGGDVDFPVIEEGQDFTEYKPNFHLPPVQMGLQNHGNREILENSSSPRDSDHFHANFEREPDDLNLGQNGPSGADSGVKEKSEMGEFMLVMKDFVTTQTQWVKMQMDQGKKGPSTSSTPCSSSTFSTFPSTSSINTSKKGFLFLLRSLVLGMDRPDFEPIRRRISREIQKIGDGDENISVETINNLLEGVMDAI